MPCYKTPKTLLDLSCEKYSELIFSSIKYVFTGQSSDVIGSLTPDGLNQLENESGFLDKDENLIQILDATSSSSVLENNIQVNKEINDYLKTLPPRVVYQIIAKCQEIFIGHWFLNPLSPLKKSVSFSLARVLVLPRLNCFYQTVIIPSVTHLDFTSLIEFGTLSPASFKYFHEILDQILVKVPQLQHLNIKCQNSRTCLPSFATHHLRLLGQHCPYLKYLDISFHNGLKNEDLLFLTPYSGSEN